MAKKDFTLSFDEEKLEALEVFLKKENTSVQKRMDEALRQLYEKTVPEPVREFVEARAGQRPKRSSTAGPVRAKDPVTDKPEPMENQEGQHERV
nr:DUF6103 family protein [uncultured Oscillibacter sp.]